MKTSLWAVLSMVAASTLGLSLSASSAHAYINEVECENTFLRPGEARVQVEIFRNRGSSVRTARVTILPQRGPGSRFEFYSVYPRRTGGANHIHFTSAGFDLDIDLFPDFQPQNFRDYRSALRIREINRGRPYTNLSCRFYF